MTRNFIHFSEDVARPEISEDVAGPFHKNFPEAFSEDGYFLQGLLLEASLLDEIGRLCLAVVALLSEVDDSFAAIGRHEPSIKGILELGLAYLFMLLTRLFTRRIFKGLCLLPDLLVVVGVRRTRRLHLVFICCLSRSLCLGPVLVLLLSGPDLPGVEPLHCFCCPQLLPLALLFVCVVVEIHN